MREKSTLTIHNLCFQIKYFSFHSNKQAQIWKAKLTVQLWLDKIHLQLQVGINFHNPKDIYNAVEQSNFDIVIF